MGLSRILGCLVLRFGESASTHTSYSASEIVLVIEYGQGTIPLATQKTSDVSTHSGDIHLLQSLRFAAMVQQVD
jgi:hypothetical protein